MTDTALQKAAHDTSFAVLLAIGLCHLLNDMVQALLPAIYPTLKVQFHLNFAQIGLVTLAFQFTASLLQPLVGYFADLKPMPYSLALGMVATLFGLLVLSVAPNYPVLLVAAMMVGLGSAVFHPEASRRGAHGLRRPLWPGAIGVPGRRQYRPGDQPADRRGAGGDLRPALHRLVCGPGAVRHPGAVPDRHLVQASWPAAHQKPPSRQASGAVAQHGDEVAGGPAGPGLLQVRLYVVHRQLLHILPDAQFRPVGAECPGASVLLPGRGGCRHPAWWARWATRSAANM